MSDGATAAGNDRPRNGNPTGVGGSAVHVRAEKLEFALERGPFGVG
jgi:hypothetical protein